MADKTSTLELAVNLSCSHCYMKMRKTLSKFEDIQCLIFDEQQNMVTISGRFNPEQLEMKLRCKARNCITGCEIKIETKPRSTPDPPPCSTPDPPPKKTPPANPPPSLAITVNVIGIPVPNVCQCQRPCYPKRCHGSCEEDKSCSCSGYGRGIICYPKRCHGSCEEDKSCSCSGHGSGIICSSPSFWK